MTPGNKEKNKEIKEAFKEKRKAFKEEEKKFKEDFKDNVMKPMNEEYKKTMKTRAKQLRVQGRIKNAEPAKTE
jgi:hypothetical protein